MDTYDWIFAIGNIGDPLADIMDWMIPPYPQCLINKGAYNERKKP